MWFCFQLEFCRHLCISNRLRGAPQTPPPRGPSLPLPTAAVSSRQDDNRGHKRHSPLGGPCWFCPDLGPGSGRWPLALPHSPRLTPKEQSRGQARPPQLPARTPPPCGAGRALCQSPCGPPTGAGTWPLSLYPSTWTFASCQPGKHLAALTRHLSPEGHFLNFCQRPTARPHCSHHTHTHTRAHI